MPLGQDEVHVWRASLGQSGQRIDGLRQSLSPDEIARAQRLRVAERREAFVVARGMLRDVLGRYLEIPPAEVAFVYNSHGKPALAEAAGREPIEFNLSHSGDVVLCALAVGRRVGVDVERHRPVAELDGIVRRYFSPGEQALLQSLPQEQTLPAFFTCWTFKEAYLKARGLGIAYPLEQLEVSMTPGAAVTLCDHHAGVAETGRWSFRELSIGAGYAGALAVEGPACRLTCRQWE